MANITQCSDDVGTQIIVGTTNASALTGTLPATSMASPTTSTFGGMKSLAASSHLFLTSLGTDGVPVAAQPAFTDISGAATAAQLPNPGAASKGGVFSKAVVANQFLTSIASADGSVTSAAIAAGDLPNHSAALITSGALALARGGTNTDLSASGSATAVLAQDASHVITARALVAADIPAIAESGVTNLVSDLALKAPLAGPALTGVPTAPTAAAGTNTTQLATTAFAKAMDNNSSYTTLMHVAGSHTAAKVAGTYAIPLGDALAVSGTGTLYPLGVIQIVAADYPTVNGITTKLRIRAQLYTNDVAPTGNFTFGLYPITRPGTSGGAGVCIFTLGTVVSGSNGATFTTPAADLLGTAVGADFALPADGPYVIGVLTTGTIATSAHVQVNAQLQIRNA